jgi:hypothetical protein
MYTQYLHHILSPTLSLFIFPTQPPRQDLFCPPVLHCFYF